MLKEKVCDLKICNMWVGTAEDLDFFNSTKTIWKTIKASRHTSKCIATCPGIKQSD